MSLKIAILLLLFDHLGLSILHLMLKTCHDIFNKDILWFNFF